LVPDRYLSFDDDRAKAQALAAVSGGFQATVDAYWGMTPEVPRPLADRFSATTARGLTRGAGFLDQLGPVGPHDTLLDVGCGTGGLLAAAASRGATVVGVDTALRWLVIARRYLGELGIDALLVAADGATLPFRSGSFTAVTSIEVLEHAADQRGLVNGCLAAADESTGRCLLITANRFTIAPEPAVRLWGVGFLPRRLAAPYVEARRHTSYRFVRPVSLAELRAFAGPRADVMVTPGELPPSQDASAARRMLQVVVERVLVRPRRAAAITPFLALRRR
jgi:SAM-dependent methyltransferase